MNIGIVTPYTTSVVTQAAVQLAHHLMHDRGDSVSILTPTERPVAVSHYWDKHVVSLSTYPPGRGFTAWFEQVKPEAVIWTQAPRPEQIEYVNKTALSVLVASGNESDEVILESYPEFHQLVAPSQAIVDLLSLDNSFSALPLRNMIFCPWSPFAAVTRKDDSKPLLWPLHLYFRFMTHTKMNRDVIDLFERLLTTTNITISVGTSQRKIFPTRQRKKFSKFRKRFDAVVLAEQSGEQVRLSQHSYTVVCDPVDAFGMAGLCSLHAGTPPIVFNAPPHNEFIQDTVNGILLPWVGGVIELPKLEKTLLELMEAPEFLLEVQGRTATGLLERRVHWESFWGRLLADPGPARD